MKYLSNKTQYTVRIISGKTTQLIQAFAGDTVLQVLQQYAPQSIDAPCGGAGTCGKCRVRLEGSVSPPDAEETALLGAGPIANGIRLACKAHIKGPLTVYTGNETQPVLECSNIPAQMTVNPAVYTRHIRTGAHAPGADNLGSILSFIGRKNMRVSVRFMRELPEYLSGDKEDCIILATQDEILACLSSQETYGFAVDIGTTTIAVYLVNLCTGDVLDCESQMNEQRIFGSDVISRIHSSAHGKLEDLKMLVTGQIDKMARILSERCAISADTLHHTVIAGNTVMMHVFLGVQPRQIGESPYTPVFLKRMEYPAGMFFSNMHPAGLTTLLPSVSGFIGSDITAGILVAGMDSDDRITLFIDLGTNGEIVLGDRDGLWACSTAAGPAFEGARISCGSGGIPGAVSSITLEDGELKLGVIGNALPASLCGSGIIDCAALLLDTGVCDYTGAFAEELSSEHPLYGYYGCIDGEPRCDLAKGVYFTQKDMREVQLAKAAIAAGVQTLLDESGITVNKIKRICLAGGFGSSVKSASVLVIGMLSGGLGGRIEFLGNTSGAGAVMAMCNSDNVARLDMIAQNVKYLELAADKRFSDYFVEHLFFPVAG